MVEENEARGPCRQGVKLQALYIQVSCPMCSRIGRMYLPMPFQQLCTGTGLLATMAFLDLRDRKYG